MARARAESRRSRPHPPRGRVIRSRIVQNLGSKSPARARISRAASRPAASASSRARRANADCDIARGRPEVPSVRRQHLAAKLEPRRLPCARVPQSACGRIRRASPETHARTQWRHACSNGRSVRPASPRRRRARGSRSRSHPDRARAANLQASSAPSSSTCKPLKPARASMMPSASPRASLARRVSTLPRSGTISRSGRSSQRLRLAAHRARAELRVRLQSARTSGDPPRGTHRADLRARALRR